MSQTNFSDTRSLVNADDEEGGREAWQLEALARIPSMPQGIQMHIASFCDLVTLGALCLVSKEWHAKALPLLWRDLDFVTAFRDEERKEATRRFFAHCDELIDTNPERFAALASHVRTLDVGRLLGINIIHEVDASEFDYFDSYYSATEERRVFDIIAKFTNLESLSIYIKSWWDDGPANPISGDALARALPELKHLTVGGQMPPLVLKGLVARPQGLKSLTLINLITTPGQEGGPDPIIFLSGEQCKSFTGLEKLHLCKLADLGRDNDNDNDDDYPSGMRWPFPRQGERDVLREWALLLRHTSPTLKALTLENRYLCSYGWQNVDDKFIEPGKTHPAEYGAHSIRESQHVLFPLFLNQEWPNLKQLTLVGMGTPESIDQSLIHLKDRVDVEVRPAARFQVMMGDATPEEVNTPIEFMNQWSNVKLDDDDE
jgi:hypothetical protein